MKNLYHKNKDKGKVYPSPSFTPIPTQDPLSVLNLLPVAILALASILSLEDREVLGYLITRSIKTTTTTSSSSSLMEEKTKKCKKSNNTTTTNINNTHKPLFDCGCFDCYTSYWVRWDSSPNRELIHQVIEAFEEHLSKGELLKNNNGSRKKKDKMGRRDIDKQPSSVSKSKKNVPVSPEKVTLPLILPEKVVLPLIELEKSQNVEEKDELIIGELAGENRTDEEKSEQQKVVLPENYNYNNTRVYARKAFPDVLGILNSRIWSLWNPNV